jgi:ketosteroid isomerase-like protein
VSQQNVEMAQRFAQHWNATGQPPWAEIDPDAVFVIDPNAFLGGTYRGHEEIRTLNRLMAEVFDQFQFEVDELIDAGDSVVGLGRLRVRGVQSGATGTQHGAVVVQFKGGRVVAYRSYLRQDDALEAVGLSKPSPQRGEKPENRA